LQVCHRRHLAVGVVCALGQESGLVVPRRRCHLRDWERLRDWTAALIGTAGVAAEGAKLEGRP
jgi:hypothetical protein